MNDVWGDMDRRRLGLLVAIQLCVGLGAVVSAPPAVAASTKSFITYTVTTTANIVRNGGTATVSATCPSGWTPVSGGYYSTFAGKDIRRLSESTMFGTGAAYQVSLVNFTGGTPGTTDGVTVMARCVPREYFSNSATKYQYFSVGADHFAAGSVACDAGWSALSANVSFTAYGETVLTSTPDLEFDGWYAKGWNDNVGSQMLLTVHCVPTADLPGVQVHQESDAAGWQTAASATCPSGLVPVTGGTYHVGGDGGAVTIDSRPTTTGWSSRSESTTGGTMYTNVICMPDWAPDVEAGGTPWPNASSTGAQWTFTAVDPAAAGGYSMAVTCRLEHGTGTGVVTDYDYQPCASPVTAEGLGEYSYTLTVKAQTSDGRLTTDNATVVIDTTPPVITLDETPNTVYDTTSFTLHAHLEGADANSSYCALDNGEDFSCSTTQGFFDSEDCFCTLFPASQTLQLTDMPEGSHVLHVKVTDDRDQVGVTDYPFRVDTTGPTTTQTAPTQRFTIGTKTVTKWTAQDPSGVGAYAVQWRRARYNSDFGTWSGPTGTGTATSKGYESLDRGFTYCYRSRGTDTLGNVGAWASTPRCTAIPLDDRDFAATGWRNISKSSYFRGTARTTSTRGAVLLVTDAEVRTIGLVAQKCSTCGRVGIYVGKHLVDTVDLHASTTKRVVVTMRSAGILTGSLKVKVLSSDKPVTIDAVGATRT
jgi:hypothetical protein